MTEAEKYKHLVCPMGKYPLEFRNDHLACPNCGAMFPVKSGIAHLIIDEAQLPEGISNYTQLKCFGESQSKK